MAGRGAALEALGTGPPPPPPPRPHPVFQTAAHAGGGARGTRGRAGAGAPRGGARVSASGLDLREAVSQVCAWPALGGVEGGLRGTVLGGGEGGPSGKGALQPLEGAERPVCGLRPSEGGAVWRLAWVSESGVSLLSALGRGGAGQGSHFVNPWARPGAVLREDLEAD